MTVLSGQTIRRMCVGDLVGLGFAPLVWPFCERTTEHGMSYGLGPAGYDLRLDGGTDRPGIWKVLEKGDFVLAATLERFVMPADLIGIVHDKSSLVRRGLSVHNTVIEPGWSGYLTLELAMHGKQPITLKQGQAIAQVVFQRLDEPAERPYDGKYQDQARGPQAAR